MFSVSRLMSFTSLLRIPLTGSGRLTSVDERVGRALSDRYQPWRGPG
jgi:hypothetical protein